jgi:hypothetical protein
LKASSAKAKGRRGAAEAKELLLKHAPELQPDDIVVTSSGDTGEDLKFSPKAREVYPWSTECKVQESLNIWAALKQAEGHSDKYPGVLFFKRNRTKLYAAMDAETFVRLCRKKPENSQS